MQCNRLVALFLAGTALLAGCQKNVETFVPDPGQPNGADTNWVSNVTANMPLAILRDSLLLQPQTDSLNSNIPDTLVTAAGVQLVLPANSLEKTGGSGVEGKVKIEFMALQKKGDLIRMNTPTITDSAVLSTAGTFFIKLTQNAVELLVKSSSAIQLKIPGTAMQGESKFYYGLTGQAGIYNWKLTVDPFRNSVDFGNNYYVASTNTLGWISAAYPLPAASDLLQLTLPPQYTNANTAAYVVLNNYRSVISMNTDVAAKKFTCSIIPQDQPSTIVVISKQGTDYYATAESFTSTAGTQVVNLLPVKMSLADMKQLLDRL